MEDFLILAFVGGIIFLAIWAHRRGTAYQSDGNGFSQAGVSVDYEKGFIFIGTSCYRATDVTDLQWGSDGHAGIAYIQVADMRKPVHEIRFMNVTHAQGFCQRLSIALRQAAQVC